MVKWLSIGWKYFNEFAVPAMQETEREKFAAYVKDVMPLFERLDKANRESLIPALTDGQSALVIDGKFASKRLHARVARVGESHALARVGPGDERQRREIAEARRERVFRDCRRTARSDPQA